MCLLRCYPISGFHHCRFQHTRLYPYFWDRRQFIYSLLSQAIAIHTFVMVWCNKGFQAIKLAYFVISLPWLFAIIYLAAISSVPRAGPDILFRPAPVSSVGFLSVLR